MVHPCGSGAFGHFECTKDMSKLTFVTLEAYYGYSGRLTTNPTARQTSSKALAKRHQFFFASVPSHSVVNFPTLLVIQEVSPSNSTPQRAITILLA